MKGKVKVLLVLALPLLMGLSNIKENKIIKTVNKSDINKDTTIVDSNAFNKELFVKYIIDNDIKHPEVAYAIARHESGFRSRLFVFNKNLFGMKHPGVRPTKSVGRKSGFAHFEKWQHSVDDYKLYLHYVQGHNMSREQYLLHLDRNYAHVGYSNYLKPHFNEFNDIKNKIINDTIN
jgi:hypothetical protein